jgi:hypothetical protein
MNELFQEPAFLSFLILRQNQVQVSVQVYTAHTAATTTARWPADDRQHRQQKIS